MKAINNYNEVSATEGGDFKRLPAGGYVCKITRVEDVPDKEYLKIEYDISEGEYKNWWIDTMERAGFWGGKFVRSYKDKAAAFFKGFATAVEESNTGYKWAWDEQSLVGKAVGLVLGEEEYIKDDNSVATRLTVVRNTAVANIRAGKFEVPPLKALSADAKNARKATASAPVFKPVEDDDELLF